MSTSSVANHPSNLFSMKTEEFYDYVESMFSFEIKELLRFQGFRSASAILHSTEHLLAFLDIDSNDQNLLNMKNMIGFYQNDGTWKVKAGVRYDVDRFLSLLNKEESNRSDGSLLVTADVLRRFSWLKSVITFCQNNPYSNDQRELTFLLAFIDNISRNLVTPRNRYDYSDEIEQFAFVLYLLAGWQGYEFVRINLPGSLPSLSTLLLKFNQNREKFSKVNFVLIQCKFILHRRMLNIFLPQKIVLG